MPVPDPKAGQAFVRLIACFLFICIAVGGGCLVAYVVEPNPSSWLPYAGVGLVCLPWLFWILTFLYRIVSRALGFRMIIGGGGGGGGGDAKDVTSSDNNELEPKKSIEEPPETKTPHDGDGGDGMVKSKKKHKSSSSSDSSVGSNESEMPLTIAMAS